MITYDHEDPPITLTIPRYSEGWSQVPAWPTRFPGLTVIHHRACERTPASWGHCFVVYPPALGDFLPMCFPIKICAAAFASVLAPRAPWALSPFAAGAAQDIRDSLQHLDWVAIWGDGAKLGGEFHPFQPGTSTAIKEYAHA